MVDSQKNKKNFPTCLETDRELQEKIEEFYEIEFWNKVNGTKIKDEDIAFIIFDFAVNAGVKTSISIVQRILEIETIHGILDENTLKKLNEVEKETFLGAFVIAKIARYINIVERKPITRKFFFGWVKRALHYS